MHLSNPKTVNGLVKLLESKGDKLKIRDAPANPQGRLSKADGPDQDQVNDPEVKAMRQLYQMVVGSLIWAQTTGRFDINTASVLTLSLNLEKFTLSPENLFPIGTEGSATMLSCCWDIANKKKVVAALKVILL